MKFKAFAIIPRKEEIEIKPLVMCKECKYAHMTITGECKYCDCQQDDEGFLIEVYHDGDWYCADGEKKREGKTRRYRCSQFGTITQEEEEDD